MKAILIISCLIYTQLLFGQSNSTAQKGNFFTSTSDEYFERTIKPWKYQFVQSDNQKANDSVNKIGQILFWRSNPVYDPVSKQYWKPNIEFDVYPDSDSALCKKISEETKLLSSCTGANVGGDIFLIGHFVLLNPSVCVNCASGSDIDYCRNIIKRIIDAIPDKNTHDWNLILQQLVIEKKTFREGQ